MQYDLADCLERLLLECYILGDTRPKLLYHGPASKFAFLFIIRQILSKDMFGKYKSFFQ